MPRVLLDIGDPANRLTLKVMLEAEGHHVVSEEPDVVFADTPGKALAYARQAPTLILAPVSGVRAAVAAMHQGVYGYLLVPFQPGEAAIMVRRALAGPGTGNRLAVDTREEGRTLAQVETDHIQAVVRRCKGNQTKAAQILGIGRNTLWRKLRRIRNGER
ncbi:MAG: hypothetical protein GWP08_15755 [Nitrospiraceae bacterium]|nr:hypothetical protein [Nitrospiraceae bacterium]